MSQNEYYIALKREIQALNEKIDSKIVRGEMYSFESRRHKMLRDIMRSYKRQKFFARAFTMFF